MKAPVSVLVPTYNRAHILGETLDSILSQSLPPSEIILVDDGSTDGTAAVVQRFAGRVTYIRVENSGVCRARNIAAAAATYPYLAFCDSDDLWREDKLEVQMNMHLEHPDLAFSFTNFAIVSEGVWSEKTKFDDAPAGYFEGCRNFRNSYLLCEEPLYDKLLEFQPIFQSTHMITSELFYQVGGYVEDLGRLLSEDLEFVLRCAQIAPIGVVKHAVVGIRKHNSNFSGDTYATTKGEVQILRYALENHVLTEATRGSIREQIGKRCVDASYGAFRRQEFGEVTKLLSDLPVSSLDAKTRLKLRISKLPVPLAKLLQGVLLKEK